MYKILDSKPVNFNDGRHNPSYSFTDKKSKHADFVEKLASPIREKSFEVAPCVLNSLVCNIASRQAAKKLHPFKYNSIL